MSCRPVDPGVTFPVLLSQSPRASECGSLRTVYARAMAGAGDSATDLTVDELAARTGMTVRTVRFYASEGLLPAPRRRGRVAYYDAGHRMRLELIRTLQDHGYTLAAIERVLARIPFDAAPAEYAVHAAALAPWLPQSSERTDLAGLERRAGPRARG